MQYLQDRTPRAKRGTTNQLTSSIMTRKDFESKMNQMAKPDYDRRENMYYLANRGGEMMGGTNVGVSLFVCLSTAENNAVGTEYEGSDYVEEAKKIRIMFAENTFHIRFTDEQLKAMFIAISLYLKKWKGTEKECGKVYMQSFKVAKTIMTNVTSALKNKN